MNIRMSTHEDISTLIKVRFDYFAAEKWELTDDKRDLIRAQLERYYSKHLNLDFFAAFVEDNNNIVSVAFLVISERPANLSWPTGKTGMILNVLTYPEHRKMGCATQVINLLIAKARQEDLSYLELSASELGKSLYTKLGFQELTSSRFTEMKMSLV